MNKKLLWVVVGLVILAGIAYGGYWLGGKTAFESVANSLNAVKAGSPPPKPTPTPGPGGPRGGGTCVSAGGATSGGGSIDEAHCDEIGGQWKPGPTPTPGSGGGGDSRGSCAWWEFWCAFKT